MRRRPPTSPLFPYTTLFRSIFAACFYRDHPVAGDISGPLGRFLFGLPCGVEIFQDRKSTRLNSSHVSISYAVFCLKKKKQSNRTNSYIPICHGASRTSSPRI